MLHTGTAPPALSRTLSTRALAVSALFHAGCLALVFFALMSRPPVSEMRSEIEKHELIFAVAGPAGGGDSAGNNLPTPARPVQMSPASSSPVAMQTEPPPPPALLAPIQTLTSVIPTFGTISGLSAAPSGGQGSSAGKGAGDGGVGGPGVGPGSGGGAGGPMGPGSGATPPTVLRSVDPTYTAAAMQARVQGTVVLEVLVTAAGTVTDVKVIDSLDRVYGLDERAIATAKKWIFRPARFQGQPVPYVVNLHLVFNLR